MQAFILSFHKLGFFCGFCLASGNALGGKFLVEFGRPGLGLSLAQKKPPGNDARRFPLFFLPSFATPSKWQKLTTKPRQRLKGF